MQGVQPEVRRLDVAAFAWIAIVFLTLAAESARITDVTAAGYSGGRSAVEGGDLAFDVDGTHRYDAQIAVYTRAGE